jgi:hypothetical protein
MNQEQILKLEESIQKMRDKKSRIYFLVQDTKGNAKASIRYIYEMAMTLKNKGFNAIILHETPDYFGVKDWLGEDYMSNLEHRPIEGSNLEISPEDLIVVPEIYGFIMDQITKLPCGKVVLSQSYDYIFETLQPGQTWSQLGFHKCITTSEKQKEIITTTMRSISVDVIEPTISEVFQKQEFPPKTIIGVHTREHRDTVNLIKTFYAKFPQYRWITFRDLRGLSQEEFTNAMKESFSSVWIDNISSFGTFPLESMKSGVPVIGIVPDLVPSWMNEDNGIWVKDQILLPELIADWSQNWLEDNISQEIITKMDETVEKLPTKESFEKQVVETFSKYINNRASSMEEQISKFTE